MKLLRLLPLQLSLVMVILLSQKCTNAQDFKVIGYLPEYRFDIADELEWSSLTHVCIGFAHPGKDGRVVMETEQLRSVINQAHDSNVKVMLSLAGGRMIEEDEDAWAVYTKPYYRTTFIKSLIGFVNFYGIDGVDVDLEFKHVDANYSGFVLELRDSIKAHNKLLSAALPGIVRYKHLNSQALKAFDFVNIMAYDFTGPFDPKRPGQHSPYDKSQGTIEFWKKQGLPSKKIILGLPFFGWDFSDQSKVKSVTFANLVERDTSFAHLDQVGDIYYNGTAMIEAKTEMAIKKTGGVMIWELGQDNFEQFSLLKRINKVLVRKKIIETKEEEPIVIKPDEPELILTYPNFDEFYVIVDNRNEERERASKNQIIGETLVKEEAKGQSNVELNTLGQRITLSFKVEGKKKAFISLPDYPPGLYVAMKMIKEQLFTPKGKNYLQSYDTEHLDDNE